VTNRFDYHQHLFDTLDTLVLAFLDQDPDHVADSRAETAELLAQVRAAMRSKTDYLDSGQQLLCRLVSHFPALTPHVPRDLLWFYGGDCLHFLTDEEIAKFQTLEEKYHDLSQDNPAADYSDIRAQVMGLH